MTDDQDRLAAALDVSRETIARLMQYEALLRKWNPKINLVAPSTLTDLWSRHFLDSAQIWRLAPGGVRSWLDLGSGGGFPALVIAMIAAEKAPELHVTMVESDARKSVFLRTVARETGLDVTVHQSRIENLPAQNADILSARALAPLDVLLGFADQHLSSTGTCLFPKGRTAQDEIAAARKTWDFTLEQFPSLTDPEAFLLRIKEISRVRSNAS